MRFKGRVSGSDMVDEARNLQSVPCHADYDVCVVSYKVPVTSRTPVSYCLLMLAQVAPVLNIVLFPAAISHYVDS